MVEIISPDQSIVYDEMSERERGRETESSKNRFNMKVKGERKKVTKT